MKTIGITASIKNNQLVVDRSIIDTVVKLGYLPLVFAPVSLKTMPLPNVNFDALILAMVLILHQFFIMKSHFPNSEKRIHTEISLN